MLPEVIIGAKYSITYKDEPKWTGTFIVHDVNPTYIIIERLEGLSALSIRVHDRTFPGVEQDRLFAIGIGSLLHEKMELIEVDVNAQHACITLPFAQLMSW